MKLDEKILLLEQRLEELERMSDENAPFDKSTARRELLIQIAVDAADSILMGFADGSTEELNYLTKEMALKWAESCRGQPFCQAAHARTREGVLNRCQDMTACLLQSRR